MQNDGVLEGVDQEQKKPEGNRKYDIGEMVVSDILSMYPVDDTGVKVAADHTARINVGEKRYGERLRAFNGRNSLLDAYQEILDFLSYMRQYLVEIHYSNTETGSIRHWEGVYSQGIMLAIFLRESLDRKTEKVEVDQKNWVHIRKQLPKEKGFYLLALPPSESLPVIKRGGCGYWDGKNFCTNIMGGALRPIPELHDLNLYWRDDEKTGREETTEPS